MLNLKNLRFGKLTVIRKVGTSKNHHILWLCLCDCGNKTNVESNKLKNGHTKSCGCLHIKHGHSKINQVTRIYNTWLQMIQRCTNTNNTHYKDYGGRGITVCNRWFKFENFNEDMGEHWKPGLTLERRNNKEGYSPENCYWATRKQQARNRRNNLYITYNKRTRLLIEWSKETRIPYDTLRARIYILGWLVKQALTTPVRKYITIVRK